MTLDWSHEKLAHSIMYGSYKYWLLSNVRMAHSRCGRYTEEKWPTNLTALEQCHICAFWLEMARYTMATVIVSTLFIFISLQTLFASVVNNMEQ